MRTTVSSLFLCLATLSVSFGQPGTDVFSNYEGTLSHLDGVAVGVTYYAPNTDADVRDLIKPQVQSKIRRTKGVTLYTEENEEEFKATEARPLLTIDVTLAQGLERNGYSIDFAVDQLVVLKGSDGEEIRRDTYYVGGDISEDLYLGEQADRLAEVQKAVNVMVDRFLKDFREAHSE